MRVVRLVLRWCGRVLVGLFAASLALVVPYHWIDPPLTPLMVIRVVEGALAGERVGIDRRPVALAEIAPVLVRSVIAAEDARFFTHWGIDLRELERARAFNARRRDGRFRGASTITMQCARSVFLWPSRTWVRKAIEVYFALLLEQLWGKRRILEVYLNVVEWGPGIYGAEAAARHWFGVPAAALDAERAALLAAALPAPRRLDPSRPSPAMRRRAATIAARARHVRRDRTALGTGDAGSSAPPGAGTRARRAAPASSLRPVSAVVDGAIPRRGGPS